MDSLFNDYINDKDEGLVEKTLLVLNNLSKCEEINLKIIEKGHFSKFFSFFENFDDKCKKFTLVMRCIGNILLGNNQVSEIFLKNGLLIIIENVLSNSFKNKSNDSLLYETLWALANLLINNESASKSLSESTNIYRLLMEIMKINNDIKVFIILNFLDYF